MSEIQLRELKEKLIDIKNRLISQYDALLKKPLLSKEYPRDYADFSAFKNYLSRKDDDFFDDLNLDTLRDFETQFAGWQAQIDRVNQVLSQKVMTGFTPEQRVAIRNLAMEPFTSLLTQYEKLLKVEDDEVLMNTRALIKDTIEQELSRYIQENEGLTPPPKQSTLLALINKVVSIRDQKNALALEIDDKWNVYDSLFKAFNAKDRSQYKMTQPQEALYLTLTGMNVDKMALDKMTLVERLGRKGALDEMIHAYKQKMKAYFDAVSDVEHELWLGGDSERITARWFSLASMESKSDELKTFLKTALNYDPLFIQKNMRLLNTPYLIENTLRVMKDIKPNEEHRDLEILLRLSECNYGYDALENNRTFLEKVRSKSLLNQLEAYHLKNEKLMTYIKGTPLDKTQMEHLLKCPEKVEGLNTLNEVEIQNIRPKEDIIRLRDALIASDDPNLPRALETLSNAFQNLEKNSTKREGYAPVWLGSLIHLLKTPELTALLSDAKYKDAACDYLKAHAYKATPWIDEIFSDKKFAVAPVNWLDVALFKNTVDLFAAKKAGYPQYGAAIEDFKTDLIKEMDWKAKPEAQVGQAFRLAKKHFRKDNALRLVALDILQAFVCLVLFPLSAAIVLYKKYVDQPFWNSALPKAGKEVTNNLSLIFKENKEAFVAIKQAKTPTQDDEKASNSPEESPRRGPQTT